MTSQEALGWALVHFLWQGLLGALAAWCVLLVTRRPETRYIALCAILLVLALGPLVTFMALHAGPAPVEHLVLQGTRGQLDVALPTPALQPFPWLIWITRLWALGALLLLLRAAGGWYLARRRGASGAALLDQDWLCRLDRLRHRLAVTKTVRVLVSAHADVPQVFGWWRPLLLIPASALANLAPDQLEALLAHELAHVRRHDFLVNLLQTVVESVLFYHPAIHWISRRIRVERELCCDRVAVEACGDALLYSKALLTLEESRLGLALGANGSPLKSRIERILGMHQERIGFTPLAALCAAVLVGGGLLWAQSEPPKPPVPPAPPAPSVEAPAPPAAPAKTAKIPSPASAPDAPVPPQAPSPAAAPHALPVPPADVPPPPPPPPAKGPKNALPAPPPPPPPPARAAGGSFQLEAAELQAVLSRMTASTRERLESLRKLKAELQAQSAQDHSNELRQHSVELDGEMRSLTQVLSQLTREQKQLQERLQSAQADRAVEMQKTNEQLAVIAQQRAQVQAEAAEAKAQAHKLQAESRELERRTRYADDRFGNATTKGSETDRGKAYIKLGPPDELEVHPGVKEEWLYRSTGTILRFDGEGRQTGTAKFNAPDASERIRKADEKWSKAGVKGSESDRGKVYIRNGPPDEIDSQAGTKETWRYRGGSTYTFDADGKLKGVSGSAGVGATGSGPSKGASGGVAGGMKEGARGPVI